MKYIKAEEKSWEQKEGYSKQVLGKESEIAVPGTQIQILKIKPGEVAKAHHHEKQTEIFYFLNNNGHFVINGEKISPQEGDVIIMEPNDVHEVSNNTQEDFLYVGFKLNYQEGDSHWN
jgi:quercetin dioxygenase-like cupin family protein